VSRRAALNRKEGTVLATYKKLDEPETLMQVKPRRSIQLSGILPSGEELKQLLVLKHGVVADEIWDGALLAPIRDLTGRSGKRFRGQLVSLAYRLTSGAGRLSLAARERCAVVGEIAELIHAGSLVVDDIQDSSSMRRGAPALHVRYGVPLALNAGNWLYFWPFELFKRAGLSRDAEAFVYQRCQRMLLRAHFGQALDVGANIESIEQDQVPGVCLASMELKSGALMGFALLLGGLLADLPEPGLSVLDEFGHDLGVALQAFDDLGNVLGKRQAAKQYEDLLLHRPSWIWACAAQDYSPEKYRQFRAAVRKLPQREYLEHWFEENGLLETCRRRALEHMNDSFEALAEKLGTQNISWSREVFRELREVGANIAEAYV
jgi:geranylgeranyl pyrophosphate synthase